MPERAPLQGDSVEPAHRATGSELPWHPRWPAPALSALPGLLGVVVRADKPDKPKNAGRVVQLTSDGSRLQRGVGAPYERMCGRGSRGECALGILGPDRWKCSIDSSAPWIDAAGAQPRYLYTSSYIDSDRRQRCRLLCGDCSRCSTA